MKLCPLLNYSTQSDIPHRNLIHILFRSHENSTDSHGVTKSVLSMSKGCTILENWIR